MRCFTSLLLLLLITFNVPAQNLNDELIAAAKKGDLETVKTLIAKGANVNARTNYGATALHFAADRGHLNVVKALVEAGADIYAKDDFYKMTPMMMAMMHKQPEVVGYLNKVAEERKNATKPAEQTPAQTSTTQSTQKSTGPGLSEELLTAARKGDLASVKSLLAKGADVNSKTSYNQTPLMFAADKGHLEIVKVLLDAGADVKVTDTFYKGFTALSAAASKGHAEIVKLLLEKGAQSKDMALNIGAQSGHASVVKVVLDQGGVQTEALNRALGSATDSGNAEIVEMLKKAGATPVAPKSLKPEVKLDDATLQKYVGTYRESEERQFTFILKDGKLSGWDVRQYSFPLTAIEKNVFRIGNNDERTITFNEEDGRVTNITVKQSGFTQTYKRVEGK